MTSTRSPLSRHWSLDPSIVFLNHGSFGACPSTVLEAQQRWRSRMESEPVRFFIRDLEGHLDAARFELASFVGADPEGLAFVPNATHGVNTVLRSLQLNSGDQLLTTNMAYGACSNALRFVAERARAQVVVANVPFPISGPELVVEAVMAKVTDRTRLVLLDHITSPTGLVFPLAELARTLGDRGIDVLVDGAHAPGMLPLDITELGVPYYTGNCHKWLCAPKGAAFLFVRDDRRDHVRPLSISHGAAFPATTRSRFRLEFDWTGTDDPTAWLCIAEALNFVGNLLIGGWPEIMKHNHQLLLAARQLLATSLGVETPCPESMLGSLAALPLPDGDGQAAPSPLHTDRLQDALFHTHHIEVPIVTWPNPPHRLVRISAQLYNQLSDYRHLASALAQELSTTDVRTKSPAVAQPTANS